VVRWYKALQEKRAETGQLQVERWDGSCCLEVYRMSEGKARGGRDPMLPRALTHARTSHCPANFLFRRPVAAFPLPQHFLAHTREATDHPSFLIFYNLSLTTPQVRFSVLVAVLDRPSRNPHFINKPKHQSPWLNPSRTSGPTPLLRTSPYRGDNNLEISAAAGHPRETKLY
jgi:hypothetical protein